MNSVKINTVLILRLEARTVLILRPISAVFLNLCLESKTLLILRYQLLS
jgi:hypothetical protein